MSIFYIILFAILLAIVPALFIWKMFLPLESKKEKGVYIAITVVLFLILEIGFIMTAALPAKINSIIDQGVVSVESYVTSIDSTFMDKPLDAKQLQEVITNSKQLKYELESNQEANLIIQLVGIDAFLSSMEDFAENIDSYVVRFEKDNVEFTFRNALSYIKQDIQPAIYFVAKVIEIIILIIAFIVYLVILIVYFGRKKGWFGYLGTPKVLYAEDYAKQDTQETKSSKDLIE